MDAGAKRDDVEALSWLKRALRQATCALLSTLLASTEIAATIGEHCFGISVQLRWVMATRSLRWAADTMPGKE